MRIVNKQEFYNLPKGTLYSYFEPNYFSGLKIKWNTLINSDGKPFDFNYEDLIGNILSDNSQEFYDIIEASIEKKTSFKLDFNCMQRDGLFEENQLFAIYEKEDLESLINKLISLNNQK